MHGENSQSLAQFVERNIAVRARKELDSVVAAVKNRINDAILTWMDNVFIPGVEIAIRSIAGSSGNGPNNVFQNPY